MARPEGAAEGAKAHCQVNRPSGQGCRVSSDSLRNGRVCGEMRLSQQAYARVPRSSLRLTQDTQVAPEIGAEWRRDGTASFSVHGSRKSRTEGGGGRDEGAAGGQALSECISLLQPQPLGPAHPPHLLQGPLRQGWLKVHRG